MPINVKASLIQFRDAIEDDLPRLNSLMRQSKEEAGKSNPKYTVRYLDEFMERLSVTPEVLRVSKVKILYVDDELAGFYSFYINSDGNLELDNFFLDPKFLYQGYGKNLWNHCLITAREYEDKSYLILWSSLEAVNFYLKRGCVIIGEKPSPADSTLSQPMLKYDFPTGFGVNDALMLAQMRNLSLPLPDAFGRYPTRNKQGFMFPISPISEQFLDNIHEVRALEIGCGFGNVTLEALRRGCRNYTACDASSEHLAICASTLINGAFADTRDHLTLIPVNAPSNLITGSFDRILVEKVIHFFNPLSIEPFIRWLHEKLTDGGEIFVHSISPDCRAFPDCREIYNSREQHGNPFPGYMRDLAKDLPSCTCRYPEGSKPESVLFLTLNDLSSLFTRSGFEILQSYQLTPPDETCDRWYEAQDMVGIRVRKAPHR